MKTESRLALELLARIAGEADPVAYVDGELAEPAGLPDDIVGEQTEVRGGVTTKYNLLRDGRKVKL